MIINELDQRGRGIKDKNCGLKSLFFSEDHLLISNSNQ